MFGVGIGVAYAYAGFRGTGDPPVINVSVGPLQNGHLFINGYHIHHWMVYPWIGAVAWLLGWYNVTSFSMVMTVHGLSYPDCLDVRR